MYTRRTVGLVAALTLAASPALKGQSIDPAEVTATMTVGDVLVIHKTITLGADGANLVDLFFLADNTGSMGGIINNAKAGATQILGNVPAGADYNFGTGRYNGDPVEGVPPASAYTETSAMQAGAAAAQAGINSWGACVGGCGGDFPEANFFGLQQMSNTAGWRTGSQRLAVWFGDAPSHTATTTEAGAIAALNAEGVEVIAFNSTSAGLGIDQGGQATHIVSATGGTLTNSFSSLSAAQFIAAVNTAITTATSTLDLVFGSTFVGSGLALSFVCTDPLGCTGVTGSESRTFDLRIEALEVGDYDFSVFAAGVAAEELDHITVIGAGSVIPEPSTWVFLITGLVGLGIVARRRKEGVAYDAT